MTTLCTNCGFNNPPGMRFCGNCGSKLDAQPDAGRSAYPDENLLNTKIAQSGLGVLMGAGLSERLRNAGLEAAGQRRNVTVLFADLHGYTAMSQAVDSEDLYEIIQEYIRLLSNDVYKYEGIVDKLTGDGLMALFGAPIAHENNAERAVLAALDMQTDLVQLSRKVKEETGLNLSMRIGLHAGTVIVGGVGSDLMMDYTAIGDTVNLAHRIEEAAIPGRIYISEAVYRQVRALFDCQQVSILNPKGYSRPVVAFTVLGRKAKPGLVRGLEGLRAPMIGRDYELNQLVKAFHMLTHDKKGQFAVITGEAGLGKSRLTAEFKDYLRQFSFKILEGQSLAYRRSIAYWIFQDVIFYLLHVPPSTPPLVVRERLMQYSYQLLGNAAGEVLPYLEHILSLPYSNEASAERLGYLDAGQLRQQIFLAVRDVLVAEAQREPFLLILEDLHWADNASLELLYFLLDFLRNTPIFILAITRQIQPGPMTKIVEWAQKHLGSNSHATHLHNLSLDQSERLLQQLITNSILPETWREQILQRAAGIPFYLEEILRMLIDEGLIKRENDQWVLVSEKDILAFGVPETLQGLILTRFDRLPHDQRQVLQVASVIGKNFAMPVLAEVLQSDVHRIYATIQALVEREFIIPKSSENDQEYTFRHISMSDAIYSTLLRKESSKLHGQVGEAIENIFADRLDSQVELLANHYRFSPRLERALNYLILAGQKAVRNNVNEQARQHFQNAFELLPKVKHQPYQAIQVLMGLGDALVFDGEYPSGRSYYQEALQILTDQAPERFTQERSMLYRKIAKTFERLGDPEQALSFLVEAQNILAGNSISLPAEQAQVWNDIGWLHFRRGNFVEAQEQLQRALSLVENSDAYDAIASIYNRLGGVAYNLGDWDRAASYLRKSIAIRESIRDVVGLAASFNNLGYLEIEMGEFDNALENLTRSYELKVRLGQTEGIAVALNNLGWLRIQRGELEEAHQTLDQALELTRQIGYTTLLSHVLKNRGELHLVAEEWDQAEGVLTEIVPQFEELGANDQLVDIYRLLGEVALQTDKLSLAHSYAQKANEIIQKMESSGKEISAVQQGEMHRFQGMLAMRTGDWESANKFLRESETIFQTLRSRLYQGRVSFQLGVLAEAKGDRRAAQLRYREAALFFKSIGARLEARRAEESRQRQPA